MPLSRSFYRIAAGISVVAAAWLGISALSRYRVDAQLNALVNAPDPDAGWRFQDLSHDGGLMTSGGNVNLVHQFYCSDSGNAATAAPLVFSPFGGNITYHLSHGVTPSGLARFSWAMTPIGIGAAEIKKMLGADAQITGEGSVGFTGTLSTSIHLPPFKAAGGDESIQFPASTGHLTFGQNTFMANWQLDKAAVRYTSGAAVLIENLRVALNITNLQRGLGTASIAIDKLSNSLGVAEGITLESEVLQHGDSIDLRLAPSIKSVKVADREAKDLTLEFALRGVLANAIDQLRRHRHQLCETPQEKSTVAQQHIEALRALVAHGLSLGLPKFHAAIGSGALNGHLMIDLLPSTDAAQDAVKVERRLKATGQFQVKGEAMSQEERDAIVHLGLAERTADGFKTTVQYEDSLLRVNGRVFDATPVHAVLEQLNAELTGVRETARLK
jgi:hypothetical protein